MRRRGSSPRRPGRGETRGRGSLRAPEDRGPHQLRQARASESCTGLSTKKGSRLENRHTRWGPIRGQPARDRDRLTFKLPPSPDARERGRGQGLLLDSVDLCKRCSPPPVKQRPKTRRNFVNQCHHTHTQKLIKKTNKQKRGGNPYGKGRVPRSPVEPSGLPDRALLKVHPPWFAGASPLGRWGPQKKEKPEEQMFSALGRCLVSV